MTLAEIELVYKARMNKLEMEIELKNRTTARICSIIANCNRDKKKQPRAFKEDDFMPKKKKTKDKKQSVKDMKTVLKMLTIMYEGKFK